MYGRPSQKKCVKYLHQCLPESLELAARFFKEYDELELLHIRNQLEAMMRSKTRRPSPERFIPLYLAVNLCLDIPNLLIKKGTHGTRSFRITPRRLAAHLPDALSMAAEFLVHAYSAEALVHLKASMQRVIIPWRSHSSLYRKFVVTYLATAICIELSGNRITTVLNLPLRGTSVSHRNVQPVPRPAFVLKESQYIQGQQMNSQTEVQ